MSIILLPWLFITALLGQSDLGRLGIAVAAVGVAGLAIAYLACAELAKQWFQRHHARARRPHRIPHPA